jgi:1-acyl-sn-glycerol-3-phosphate acyltransferase
VSLVGDAEIIPLGTRGRPGRGTGSTTPSSRSRDLATQATRAEAREQHPSVRVPAQKKAAQKTAPEKQAARIAETNDGAVTETETSVVAAEPTRHRNQGDDMTEPNAESSVPRLPHRAPVTAEHRHPGKGIPPLEWLSAFTSASKEVFGDNWEPRLAEFLAFLRRRLTGDFAVDDYGFDREVTEQFLVAALRPIARRWFRIEVRGAENIPAEGGALVVSNHSGTIPVDGLMTAVTIHERTQRFLRPLGADLVFKLPVVGDLARKGGATLACNEDAERMLRGGELVGVWPEGFKGIGKPFSERYKLQRFGRGGFVSAALRTGVPIIPTSVVGAEEIYPLVGNIPSLARLLGIPYLPITPLFPLLGPLGLIPLPSKWLIEFGEPIRTDDYDEGAADDPMLVFNVTDQVRESIQQTLYSLLMQRKSVFS